MIKKLDNIDYYFITSSKLIIIYIKELYYNMIDFMKKHRLSMIILLFFIFYCINYYLFSVKFCMISFPRMSRFFGADAWRVFEDMTNLFGNHYRISVHPLFMIIIFPFVSVLKGLYVNPTLTIMILISFISTLNCYLFYKILQKLFHKDNMAILGMVLFSICSSQLVFSAIPETFIFSLTIFLVSFLFFIHLLQTKKLVFKDYLMIIVLGVLSIAFTITNIVLYFSGIMIVFLFRKDKNTIMSWIFSVIIIICISTFLFWIQSHIFPNAPGIMNFIQDNFSSGEEMKYMNFSFSIDKIWKTFQNFFSYSLLLGSIGIKNDNLYSINYSSSIIVIALSLIIWLYGIIKRIINKSFCDFIKKPTVIILMSMLFENICLHFVYGYNEQFLYSQHYSWIVLLLLFELYHNLNINKKTIIGFVVLFVFNNIAKYINIVYLAYLMNDGIIIGKREIIILTLIIILTVIAFIIIIITKISTKKLLYIIPILYLISILGIYYTKYGMDSYYGDLNIHPFTDKMIE